MYPLLSTHYVMLAFYIFIRIWRKQVCDSTKVEGAEDYINAETHTAQGNQLARMLTAAPSFLY